MVSYQNQRRIINNVETTPTLFYGLSSDDKPTQVGNGSCFLEMDTSSVYFYDEAHSVWLEWGAAPASSSVATLTANPSPLSGTADLGIVNPSLNLEQNAADDDFGPEEETE